MNTFSQLLQTLLGISVQPKDLTFLQVSIRGVVVFIAALIMVRLKLHSLELVLLSYSAQLRESGAGVNCAHCCSID